MYVCQVSTVFIVLFYFMSKSSIRAGSRTSELTTETQTRAAIKRKAGGDASSPGRWYIPRIIPGIVL